jgi:RNA polymerase sigma factor (sigma-70 family)
MASRSSAAASPSGDQAPAGSRDALVVVLMLIAQSTSSAVSHAFADVLPPASRSDSPSVDRVRTDIEMAIEILRSADISADGMLTVEEAGALELVYRRYAPVVARVAAAILRNAADAEDVTQDVFANLPKALRRYQPGNFNAWLKTVTARTVLMRMRRQRREAEIETSLAVGVDDYARFEGDIRVDSDRVQAALQRLPDSLRSVVELRLLRGLTHAEIGRQLGLTSNACEVRLCRALKQLRVMIGEGLCVQ